MLLNISKLYIYLYKKNLKEIIYLIKKQYFLRTKCLVN